MVIDPTMLAFGRHLARRHRKNQPVRIPPMEGSQLKDLVHYLRHRRVIGAFMTRHIQTRILDSVH